MNTTNLRLTVSLALVALGLPACAPDLQERGAAESGAPAAEAQNAERQARPSFDEILPDPAPPIELIREFQCVPNAVSTVTDIADVQGLPGAVISIAPTEEDCLFELAFRDAAGVSASLSKGTPGGYLLAVGGVTPGGDLMVCASNIQHSRTYPATDSGAPHERRIDRVTVECATRSSGTWSPLQPIVEADGPWAAWVVGIEASDSRASAFRVLWIHDFSYQFLNLSNKGRPAEDGLYATTFVRTSDGDVIVEAAQRVSDVIPKGSAEHEPWTPTEQERAALQTGYIEGTSINRASNVPKLPQLEAGSPPKSDSKTVKLQEPSSSSPIKSSSNR